LVEEYKKIPLRQNKYFWALLVLGLLSLYAVSNYLNETGQYSSLQNNLQAAQTGLSTCINTRDSFSSQLNTCSSDLDTTSSNYQTCISDLATCNASLNDYISQSGSCANNLVACQGSLRNFTNLYTSCSASLSACDYNYNSVRTNFDILVQNYADSYCCQANLFQGGHNYQYYYTTNNDIGCTDTATTYTKTVQC